MLIPVLLTSAGVATAKNVIYGLRKSEDLKMKIISVDTSRFSSHLYLSDSFYIVPPVNHPDYIDSLVGICRKEKIKFIFPLLSKEVLLISKNKDVFENNNIKILISDPSIVNLCNDKVLFSKFLQENGFKTPNLYNNKYLIKYPSISKPRNEIFSRKNIFIINNDKTRDFVFSSFPNNIIQEYIEGNEYTIDCLIHKEKIYALCPRLRLEVKDGKCTIGKTVYDNELTKETRNLINKIGLEGPCNIQVIKDRDNNFYFIEINPRLAAGGLTLTIQAGLNIPEMMVKLGLGLKVCQKEYYKNNLYMSKYFNEIFLIEHNGRLEKYD